MNRTAELAATATDPNTNPLERVWAASRLMEDARMLLVEAVDQARADRHTWADIGDQLGVSRQAAFNRFGERDRSAY